MLKMCSSRNGLMYFCIYLLQMSVPTSGRDDYPVYRMYFLNRKKCGGALEKTQPPSPSSTCLPPIGVVPVFS